jgi:hypothetical protein
LNNSVCVKPDDPRHIRQVPVKLDLRKEYTLSTEASLHPVITNLEAQRLHLVQEDFGRRLLMLCLLMEAPHELL